MSTPAHTNDHVRLALPGRSRRDRRSPATRWAAESGGPAGRRLLDELDVDAMTDALGPGHHPHHRRRATGFWSPWPTTRVVGFAATAPSTDPDADPSARRGRRRARHRPGGSPPRARLATAQRVRRHPRCRRLHPRPHPGCRRTDDELRRVPDRRRLGRRRRLPGDRHRRRLGPAQAGAAAHLAGETSCETDHSARCSGQILTRRRDLDPVLLNGDRGQPERVREALERAPAQHELSHGVGDRAAARPPR